MPAGLKCSEEANYKFFQNRFSSVCFSKMCIITYLFVRSFILLRCCVRASSGLKVFYTVKSRCWFPCCCCCYLVVFLRSAPCSLSPPSGCVTWIDIFVILPMRSNVNQVYVVSAWYIIHVLERNTPISMRLRKFSGKKGREWRDNMIKIG